MLALRQYVVLLKTIKPGSFIWDLITTTLTVVITVIMNLLLMRLLAERLGPEQFGAYALSRRIVATVIAVCTMSIGVAIPRYIAIASGDIERHQYFLSGSILGIVPGIIILIVGTIFARPLTLLIFHSQIYQLLFLATLWLITGTSLFTVLYAFYRGLQQMQQANLWQIALQALGPLLIAWRFATSGRADLVVALLAVLMWLAIIPLGFIAFRAIRQSAQPALRVSLRQMIDYGLPRVPGGLALTALFAVGPFLAPYFGSLKEAGYLAAGQSVLMFIQSGLMAFGLVALPKLAQMVAEQRQVAIQRAVEDIIALVLHLGLFVAFQAIIWADEIVLTLLGSEYHAAIPLMRVVLLALVPYLAYVMLRSVVDALEERAINTVNLFIALLVALIVGLPAALLGLEVMGLAIGTTVGFIVLGISTVSFLARTYHLHWQALRLKQVVALNLVILALSLFARVGLTAILTELPLLLGAGTMVLSLAICYTLVLARWEVGWLIGLQQRILVRRER